jgi:hypothetical protein
MFCYIDIEEIENLRAEVEAKDAQLCRAREALAHPNYETLRYPLRPCEGSGEVAGGDETRKEGERYL